MKRAKLTPLDDIMGGVDWRLTLGERALLSDGRGRSWVKSVELYIVFWVLYYTILQWIYVVYVYVIHLHILYTTILYSGRGWSSVIYVKPYTHWVLYYTILQKIYVVYVYVYYYTIFRPWSIFGEICGAGSQQVPLVAPTCHIQSPPPSPAISSWDFMKIPILW